MLWPRMALQSLEFSSVTTARASTDYRAGGNDQWKLGLSSLFLDSLALRPTKDNFFSTDAQPTNKKGVERFNRLQAVVSTLTTGPVFPSDAVGCSDVALIMKSCTDEGLLLRPDVAATNLDSNILEKALARGTGGSEPGELQSTFSTIPGIAVDETDSIRIYYVLAANTSASYSLIPNDFMSTTLRAAAYMAFEANSSSSVVRVNEKEPLRIPRGDRWSFNYWTLSPVLSNGFTFLGEAGTKWVAGSVDRFSKVTQTKSGLEVIAKGTAGEKVSLSWCAPDSLVVTTVVCSIPAGGELSISIPRTTC